MRHAYALLLLAYSISMFAAEGGSLRLSTQPPAPPNKVKLDDLEQLARPLISANVTKAILQVSPSNLNESVYLYFRKLGTIFYGMSTNLNFDPVGLGNEMAVNSPMDDGYMLDTFRLIHSLYTIAYKDRNNAEYPPAEWMLKVSNLFGAAVNAGIRQAGKESIIK